MRRLLALALALLAITSCSDLLGAPGASTACLLAPVARVPIVMHGNTLVVHASIDGAPLALLVDTGAERTLLTEAAVERLRLARDPRHATRTYGIGTPTTSLDARLPDGLLLGNTPFRIERVSVGSFGIAPLAGDAADGLLGADLLLPYDLDLDLPAHEITLYWPRTACPQAAPPWTQPYVSLPGVIAKSDRLLVPFELDGVRGMGVLDTGAQLSSISRRMARRTGLVEAALEMDRTAVAHGAAPEQITVRIHRFHELRVGPGVMHAPDLPVVPMTDTMGDALIGADFFRGRRVWVSFATQQVFVTRLASGPLVTARAAN